MVKTLYFDRDPEVQNMIFRVWERYGLPFQIDRFEQTAGPVDGLDKSGLELLLPEYDVLLIHPGNHVRYSTNLPNIFPNLQVGLVAHHPGDNERKSDNVSIVYLGLPPVHKIYSNTIDFLTEVELLSRLNFKGHSITF